MSRIRNAKAFLHKIDLTYETTTDQQLYLATSAQQKPASGTEATTAVFSHFKCYF